MCWVVPKQLLHPGLDVPNNPVSEAVMSEAAQAVLDQAMKLSVEERERLVGQLMRSIDEVPLTDAEAEALDAEWAPEIRRRVEEIDSGRVRMIPWDEAKAELRKLIGA